jgi:hypothetical protein
MDKKEFEFLVNERDPHIEKLVQAKRGLPPPRTAFLSHNIARRVR